MDGIGSRWLVYNKLAEIQSNYKKYVTSGDLVMSLDDSW